MALIRLVHPKYYSRKRNRFTSHIYKNLHDGMSVIDKACAERCSRLIRLHALKFYTGLVGDPVMYYPIEESEIPPGGVVEQSTSESGDECHHDIKGLTDTALRQAFKKKIPASIVVCENDKERLLAQEDIDAFPASEFDEEA